MTWKNRAIRGGCLTSRAGRWRLAALLVALAALNLAPARAQEAEGATAAEEVADGETLQPMLDLGEFKIRELRPTRSETVKVQFELHLMFSKVVDEQMAARLETWRHRLRDQVITAVRTAETVELSQPDLGRLRRKIHLRIDRLLKGAIVEDVLFASFTFRLE